MGYMLNVVFIVCPPNYTLRQRAKKFFRKFRAHKPGSVNRTGRKAKGNGMLLSQLLQQAA